MINELFPIQEYQRDGFLVSTDPTRFDLDAIHDFLANESYWRPGIAKDVVARYMQYSYCFGLYAHTDGQYRQAGFARLMTDFTTYAYLADVFVLRPFRGQGLGKWLLTCIMAHPELQNLRKWTLDTRDAHTLYTQFGFNVNPRPENHMVYMPEHAQTTTD